MRATVESEGGRIDLDLSACFIDNLRSLDVALRVLRSRGEIIAVIERASLVRARLPVIRARERAPIRSSAGRARL